MEGPVGYFLILLSLFSSWRPRLIEPDRYYWAGTKMYDLLAGAENIESSYFLSKSKALDAFPMLKQEDLFGALVYYGQ